MLNNPLCTGSFVTFLTPRIPARVPLFFYDRERVERKSTVDVPKSAIDENPTSDALPTYPPIAFDVEITMLQSPFVIDGSDMINLANDCDNYARSSRLKSEERANKVRSR